MAAGIYKLTSPSGRIYIGQSVNLEKRISHYKHMHCKEQRLIYSSLNKYGFDSHKVEYLFQTDDLTNIKDVLNELERDFIYLYDCIAPNGLNLRSGGESHLMSDETKLRMSLISKGKKKRVKHIHKTIKLKEFSLINNEVVNNLSLEDIYRYTALCFTPIKNGYTDTTIEQLAKITNENKRSLETFPQRLKKTGIVKINVIKGSKIRNHYYLIQGTNYRMIYNKILTVNISSKAKGLLIAICCMTINNTNKCGFNKTLIATKLKASKTTVLRCFKELEEALLIVYTKSVVSVSETILKVAQKAIVKDLLTLLAFNGKCKGSKIVNYYISNPGKLRSFENLSLSILSGTVNSITSPFKGPT